MRLVDLRNRDFLGILRILELKIKLLAHECGEKFEFSFRECFAKTDSTAPMERSPAIAVSLFTIRSQWEWIWVIEPLRQELRGSLPLLRVVASATEVYRDHVAFLELVLSKFHILHNVVEDRSGAGRLEPQSLFHAHSEPLKLLNFFHVDTLVEECVSGQLCKAWICQDWWLIDIVFKLLSKLGERAFVICQEADKGLRH